MHPIALTTLAHLKQELGLKGTTKDDRLKALIERASAWIESQTKRKLKARRYKASEAAPDNIHPTTKIPDQPYLFLNGNDLVTDGIHRVFYLPAYPVQEDDEDLEFKLWRLQGRDEDGEVWGDPMTEWSEYLLERETGALRLVSGASGHRNYRVQMAAGYLEGDNEPYVPFDLEDLCIQVCKKLYKEAGIQSERIGTWSRSYNAEKQDELIHKSLWMFTRQSL